MIRIITFIAAAIFAYSMAAMGQDVAPATSDDIKNFDSQISQIDPDTGKPVKEISDNSTQKEKKEKKEKKQKNDNFGQIVSAEAHRLKESGEKKDFGKWVSEQRRQDTSKKEISAETDKKEVSTGTRRETSGQGSGQGKNPKK